MLRVGLYARVSTADQDCHIQLRELRDHLGEDQEPGLLAGRGAGGLFWGAGVQPRGGVSALLFRTTPGLPRYGYVRNGHGWRSRAADYDRAVQAQEEQGAQPHAGRSARPSSALRLGGRGQAT
jgi:hypothetical protein